MKVWFGIVLMLGGFAACSDEPTPADDTTADTIEETAEVEDTVAPDTTPDTEPETTEPDTPDTFGKVTWDAVHGIFASKCGTCHGGFLPNDGSGNHAIGSGDRDVAYAASQRDANFAQCAGKKVGECAFIRISNGSMPQGKNCAGNPNATGCVTAAEQQLIQDWIRDGMLR